MENQTLAKLLQSDKDIAPYFRGIYVKSDLGNVPQLNYGVKNILVVNTVSNNEQVGHFLLIYLSPAANFFLDSFNENPRTYGDKIFNFLLTVTDKNYVKAPFRVQSVQSSVCGYYILYWAKILATKEVGDLHELFRNFDHTKYHANDTLVVRFVKDIFGK